MKSLALNPFILVKAVFTGLKQHQLSSSTNEKASNSHVLDKEQNEESNSKPDMSEFQRKAYAGNFFAGPHCVFNPGFF